MIRIENLNKSFKVFDRREGLRGACQDLFSRRYRQLDAVKDLSFHVKAGDITGYIGANGAGKSTSIKILTGILHPTSGTVRVAGFDPHRDRKTYLYHIGVVFGQRTQLWWDLAVQESFRLLQRIYGVSESDYTVRMKKFDEVLGLGEYLPTPVRKLSLGQKMRCELAAALLHRPKVLFLDEPTIGLDLVAKESIRRFLKEINRDFGTTILLTTHDLKDIEELCRDIIIIDKGRKLYDGDLAQLHRTLSGDTTINFHLGKDGVLTVEQDKGGSIRWEQKTPTEIVARFDSRRATKAEIMRLAMERYDVHDMKVVEPSIDDVVRRVYASAPG